MHLSNLSPSLLAVKRERCTVGPYRLVRLLGAGGMGVVWLARHREDNTQVAIKMLPYASASPTRRHWFAREIETLAALDHPSIPHLYDSGTLSDATPWFAMQCVPGTLLSNLQNRPPHSSVESMAIFYRLRDTIRYLHGHGIVHRDLKPSNILIDVDHPYVLDFGVARKLSGPADAGITADLAALDTILQTLLSGLKDHHA